MTPRAILVVAVLIGSVPTLAPGAVGDLDPSFGAGGANVTQLGTGPTPSSVARSVTRQPDGRLVAAGTATDQLGRAAITLARYLPTGQLDTSFGPGGSGVVMTQLGAGASPGVRLNGPHGVALAPDGGLVVCGQATDANDNAGLLVVRYTSAGALDPSFASGGKFALQLSTYMPSGISGVIGCTVAPDGRVVGAGYRDYTLLGGSRGTEAVVLVLDAHGTPDPGFGSGGFFIQQLSLGTMQLSDASDVLLLPDGRIVVSIDGRDAGNNEAIGVAQLTASGDLDPNFGTTGYTLLAIGTFAGRVGRQADGHIVVGGGGKDGMGNDAMLAARFTAGGVLDPSFGDSGRKVVQPSAAATPSSAVFDLEVQPSDKLVLVGNSLDTLGNSELAVARLSAGGALDPAFGGTGIVLKQLAGGSSAVTLGEGGVFTPDGGLVVSGYVAASAVQRWYVARFVADLPPAAIFSVAPASPVVGDVVTLDASGSTDPDGRVAGVSWDLNGDGVYGDATGPTATMAFAAGGGHVVGVAVADDDGVTATATATVHVACGTARTFASVDCRLAALATSVEAGVPPGRTRDRLSAALGAARTFLGEAASAPAKAARRALGKTRHALGTFLAGVRAGRKGIGRPLRHELVADANGVRTALGKLPISRR